MRSLTAPQQTFILALAFCVLLAASLASAWTGPTATAPAGNVSAPINVGSTDQVKNGGLSVNAFAVFGSAYVQNALGIGRVSPVVALDVNGTARFGNGGEVCQAVTAGSLRYNSGSTQFEYCNGTSWTAFSSSSSSSGQWSTSGSSLYYNGGSVGIGVVPNTNWGLDVQTSPNGIYGYATGNGYGLYGYAPASGGVGIRADGYAYGGRFTNTVSGSDVYLGYGSWGMYTGNQIGATILYDTNNTGYYVDPSSQSNMNTINVNGYYVGGVAGVSYNGTFYCNAGIFTNGIVTSVGINAACTGNDIAEPMPVDGALTVERGSIVALSTSTATYELTVTNPAAGESTTTPYTMTVAKVHTALPGERAQLYGAVPTRALDISDDRSGKGRAAGTQLVSLAGHVPVHVTLENGPIAIGDPITLSATKAGFGTKATTPGKILGFALAPYNGEGSDMIEVSMRVQEWQPAGEICAYDASGSTCLTRAELDRVLRAIQ